MPSSMQSLGFGFEIVLPLMVISPLTMGSRPYSARTNSVLPAPIRPKMPSTSPCRSSSEQPFTPCATTFLAVNMTSPMLFSTTG